MDPMVGCAAVCDSNGALISDSSDNADLLDICFLCSRQFFHPDLDNYGTERLKDEDVLELFFEELGSVDRSLLQCCPACKALCKTLLQTREALSSLIDEITSLLLTSRKVSFLLSKSRVVSRLFQSSNSSLPPCETSTGYLQQPLSQMNFPKDALNSNTSVINKSCFPTKFDLKLDSSNLSVGDIDTNLVTHSTPISVIKRSPLASSKKQKNEKKEDSTDLPTEKTSFNAIYNESIMNSVSDNACDISEGVIRLHQNKKTKSANNGFLAPSRTPSPKKYSGENKLKNGWKKQPLPEVASKALTFNSTRKVNPTLELVTSTQKQHDGNKQKSTMNAFTNNKCKTLQPTSNFISQSNQEKVQNGQNPSSPTYSTKYQCVPCNKSFKCARNLRNHLSAHNQERKFICEICGVSYRHKVGLDSHVAIHNGDPKYSCEICSKIFTQKSGLQRHMRIHTQKFQFVCDLCGKQFLHHTSFKAHKLTHDGTREFKCSHCDQTFAQCSHLTRHLRIHTGEKPFKCQLCDRSFSERYNLQVHKKIHESDPKDLFKCPKCSKTFTRKFKLKEHLRKIHFYFHD